MGRPPVGRKLPNGHGEIILHLDLHSSVETKRPPRSQSRTPTPPTPSRTQATAENNLESDTISILVEGELPLVSPMPPIDLADISVPIVSSWYLHHMRKQPLRDILGDRLLFYMCHRHFMIGPSFSNRFWACIQQLISCSDGQLLDAYQAVFNIWDTSHHVKAPNEVDLAKGSHCLQRLRSTTESAGLNGTEGRSPLYAAALLMVGQVLLVYHMFTTCTSAHTIIQHVLLQAEEAYPVLLAQPALDPITITPVIIDTVECLVRRECPIIHVKQADRFIVDRSIGLCWTLLPLLQQLCITSHECKMKTTSTALGPLSNGSVNHAFTDIERKIKDWEPLAPPSFFSDFTPLEASAMLLQARVYRTAALLIIHRLRNPLGVNDEKARWYADLIHAELASFLAATSGGKQGLPIGLPFLVAALEMKGCCKEALAHLSAFSSNLRYGEDLQRFIDNAWAASADGFTGTWFDLVDNTFTIPVMI